jgi:hypothetical protein
LVQSEFSEKASQASIENINKKYYHVCIDF